MPIRPIRDDSERSACAQMMASSEPWVSLRRSLASCESRLSDPDLEGYVAEANSEVQGFVLIDMRGIFAGYIPTICVRDDLRGAGIGSDLLEYAEQRIFLERPNVFLCVASFNDAAQRFYQRKGYETVGVLKGFIVDEFDEILMRKSVGSYESHALKRLAAKD